MMRSNRFLRAAVHFACVPALLCCWAFVPGESNVAESQANELEGVYVAGSLYKRGHNVVVVWENGLPKQLTDTKGYALAVAVSVCGDDVYIAGNAYDTSRRHCKATVWKNGVSQVLEGGETENTQVTAMVIADGDVYAVGWVEPKRSYPGRSIAALWRNGVLTRLTDGSAPAHAEAVAVAGGNVYVGGQVYGFPNVAALWKNGVLQSLPDGEDVNVEAIAVLDDTVYVAGTAFHEDGVGTSTSTMLWRNSMPVDLGHEWSPDEISIDRGDLYILGELTPYDEDADNHMVLWKNGKISLLPGVPGFEASAVTVSNGSVYAAGRVDWRTAMVWKNGKSLSLQRPAGFKRYVPHVAGIFVK